MTQQNLTGGRIENMMHERQMKFRPFTVTLAGNLTLTPDHPPLIFADPGGAGRTITLPAEADSEGLFFIIMNTADALEVLTIEDDTPTTVVTPTQDECAVVFCDGTTWQGFVAAKA